MGVFDRFDFLRVISLPSREDRRTRIRRELARVGAEARFFDAIRPTEPAGFSGIGVRGCYLSHLGALREALEMGAGRALIFEDDAILPRDFPAMAPPALAELDGSGWDVAYLGHLDAGPLSPTGHWSPCGQDVMGMHGYAIAGHALPRIVAGLDTILTRAPGDPAGGPQPVDGALSTIRRQLGLRTWVAVPPLCRQASSRSDISTPKWFDELPLVRSAAAWARRAKAARAG